ncbi:hypothetical protein Cgig2_018186 [Carnegiea gigantea]|uniref:TLC domain-containing protein n=1 Tax=Carnegiea gigantea TaxID=171969 RepID=A0A9Q1KXN5_9CARY|nr:hypothetical protein Cgig2_018186 [Carnegiea gigantea]
MDLNQSEDIYSRIWLYASTEYVIYALAHKMFRNWDPKYRYDACSCFLSLFHGTPSSVSALFAMFIIKDPQNSEIPFGFGSQNSPFQNLVLEFSTSYFIMDLLHYFVFKPHDVLFIAHHLATLFVLLTCRFLVNHGAFAILVILVLAEITSPVQNVWSLARLRKNDVPMAAKLYNFLSPGFYVLYTVARGVLAPAYVVNLGCAYASGAADGVIPEIDAAPYHQELSDTLASESQPQPPSGNSSSSPSDCSNQQQIAFVHEV